MESDREFGPSWADRVRNVGGLWGGLALVGAGFVAVAVGWTEAASTPDVRVQIQALISGGLGGVALVVGGGFLVLAHLTEYGFRRMERQLDRVAGALLDLAREARDVSPNGSPSPGSGLTAALPEMVEASHASYHAAGCDLLEGRQDTRSLAITEARVEGLSPCKVCIGELVMP